MDLDQATEPERRADPVQRERCRWWEHGAWAQLVGDPATFSDHWGRLPLVRTSDSDLGAVFDVGDAERLLANGLRRPAFRLVRDGTTLPDATGCRPVRVGGRVLDDVADPRRIADEVADGATVVLQSLQRLDARVASFADALAGAAGHGVQVNAYLSPPAARGLGSHRDAHDVLVLQVEGVKDWTVEHLGDVTLQPGTVMYVPAGVAHAARTRDSSSFHLTVGIFPVTLRHVVDRLLTSVRELDGRLPPWFATDDDADAAAAAHEALQAATAALLHADIGAALRATAAASVRLPDETAGWLRARLEPIDADVDDTSTIELRTGCVLAARTEGASTTVLHCGPRSLSMPAVAEPALAHLVSRRASSVADLPGLDGPSRLVLARRLLRERFASKVNATSVSDTAEATSALMSTSLESAGRCQTPISPTRPVGRQ